MNIHAKIQLPLIKPKKLRDDVMKTAVVALRDVFVRHFEARNRDAVHRTSNNGGIWKGTKTNYWGNVARHVYVARRMENLSVNVKYTGVALHYYGGVVKPVNAKNLAIPLKPEALGVYPSSVWDSWNLFVVKNKITGKRCIARENHGKLWYLWRLVPSAMHKPDKTVIPSYKKVRNALVKIFPKRYKF